MPPRGLIFNDFRGKPAHLNYCFPVISTQAVRPLTGKLEFDLKLAKETENLSKDQPGYFCYSVSPDGQNWTIPIPLKSGHQKIKLSSAQGTCYVSLSGKNAVIDNLSVILKPQDPDPNILHVPAEYETIQQAIRAAKQGQIVEVAPGTYYGKGNVDIELLGKAITVRSAEGPRKTIINCNPPHINTITNHRGFYIHQAERHNTVIKGFTIKNGRIRGSEIPADNMRWNLSPEHPIGAGIYCEFSSPTIKNCIIENCGSELGAGIGCVGSRAVIENCKIEKCLAGGFGTCRSGGLGAGIGLIRHSRAKIIHCKIKDNKGYYNSEGGGIYTRRSFAKIIKCDISGNGIRGNNITGGGIYCGPGSDMRVENCLIYKNEANRGAGVYTESKQNNTEYSPNCWFTSLLVKNCTIAHNRLLYPMPIYPGAGIHSSGTNINVRNCIVWYNKPTQIIIRKAVSKYPVTFSNVQGGYPYANTDLYPGNINKKPLFANPELPDPDYHLKSVVGRYLKDPIVPYSSIRPGHWVKDKVHSPCIDAGDPRDSFRIEPMPNGYRINMGAYGNTRQASKSKRWIIFDNLRKGKDYNPDINNDGKVDMKDFTLLLKNWLQGEKGMK
jgi:hypothetical protein